MCSRKLKFVGDEADVRETFEHFDGRLRHVRQHEARPLDRRHQKVAVSGEENDDR